MGKCRNAEVTQKNKDTNANTGANTETTNINMKIQKCKYRYKQDSLGTLKEGWRPQKL